MTKKEINKLMKSFNLKVKSIYSDEDLLKLKDLVKTNMVGSNKTYRKLSLYINGREKTNTNDVSVWGEIQSGETQSKEM